MRVAEINALVGPWLAVLAVGTGFTGSGIGVRSVGSSEGVSWAIRASRVRRIVCPSSGTPGAVVDRFLPAFVVITVVGA